MESKTVQVTAVESRMVVARVGAERKGRWGAIYWSKGTKIPLHSMNAFWRSNI